MCIPGMSTEQWNKTPNAKSSSYCHEMFVSTQQIAWFKRADIQFWVGINLFYVTNGNLTCIVYH